MRPGADRRPRRRRRLPEDGVRGQAAVAQVRTQAEQRQQAHAGGSGRPFRVRCRGEADRGAGGGQGGRPVRGGADGGRGDQGSQGAGAEVQLPAQLRDDGHANARSPAQEAERGKGEEVQARARGQGKRK